jgi:hypothetical protein
VGTQRKFHKFSAAILNTQAAAGGTWGTSPTPVIQHQQQMMQQRMNAQSMQQQSMPVYGRFLDLLR